MINKEKLRYPEEIKINEKQTCNFSYDENVELGSGTFSKAGTNMV